MSLPRPQLCVYNFLHWVTGRLQSRVFHRSDYCDATLRVICCSCVTKETNKTLWDSHRAENLEMSWLQPGWPRAMRNILTCHHPPAPTGPGRSPQPAEGWRTRPSTLPAFHADRNARKEWWTAERTPAKEGGKGSKQNQKKTTNRWSTEGHAKTNGDFCTVTMETDNTQTFVPTCPPPLCVCVCEREGLAKS